MLFAYYIHALNPFLVQFGPGLGVRWYGLAYVAAFVVGIALYKRLARRGYSDLQPEAVTDFIVWGAIFGVVLGGRLGYMLFYDWDAFRADPFLIFRLWDGGMASHGGIAGLSLYTLWYARAYHVSWRNLCDNLVVVGPLGLLFGRVANFINGELYGRAATVPWAIQFPKELYTAPAEADAALRAASAIDPNWTTISQVEQAARVSPALREALAGILTPRHPSQLYEAALEGALLFCLLWLLRTRVRLPNGVLTGVFFIAYAGVRIIGELFREPDAPLTGPFTRGQFLSLFLVLIGAACLVFAWLRPSWPPRWRQASSRSGALRRAP
ncbi:MAG: prolipoprotein diacylglyceryl transferase [Terrimicrobiaceae bacterium]|nr:prolipoprotein diacylglyceryl transferase [Terrimicrobiaceae bacterium]